MKAKDFLKFFEGKSGIVVTFQEGIQEFEGPDPGMKAKFISWSEHDEDVLKIDFDFSDFEEHNKKLATPVFYNKETDLYDLNWFQTPYSPKNGKWLCYFDPGSELPLKVDSEKTLDLFKKYNSEKISGMSYVEWLESKVTI